METNCQPNIHPLPDGTTINFGGTIYCQACAERIPAPSNLTGRLAEHVSRASGYYRVLELDKAVPCPSCGLVISIFYMPCGSEGSSLFAKVAESVKTGD